MIVLASKSPRRQVLLRYLVDDFEARPVDVTEEAPHALSIEDALEVIARKKALAASHDDQESWILGADTVVSFRGEVLGKAHDRPTARLRLAMLSGEVHEVSTGIALAYDEQAVDAAAVTTRVRFDHIPKDVLEQYLREDHWMGKAGAYGIQDPLLAPYIHIESGPWSNVVGLPLEATATMLRRNDLACNDPPSESWLQDHNPFDNAKR